MLAVSVAVAVLSSVTVAVAMPLFQVSDDTETVWPSLLVKLIGPL